MSFVLFCQLCLTTARSLSPRYDTGYTDAVVAAWTASLPDIELPLVLCFHFPYACSSPPVSHLDHNPLITPTASELSVKNPPYVFPFFLIPSPSLLISFLPTLPDDYSLLTLEAVKALHGLDPSILPSWVGTSLWAPPPSLLSVMYGWLIKEVEPQPRPEIPCKV